MPQRARVCDGEEPMLAELAGGALAIVDYDMSGVAGPIEHCSVLLGVVALKGRLYTAEDLL